MPRFLRAEEVPPAPAGSSTSVGGPSRLKVDDVGTWTHTFDREATEDLGKLQSEMRQAETLDDVLYAALELLALSLDFDLEVPGKYGRGRKRVTGLW